jgi:WD40 repeat protein
MTAAAAPTTNFYVTSGTIPVESASYVERRADRELLAALTDGEFCFLLNARQMGKSSLSVRTMAKLEAAGIRTAFVDLTKIGGQSVTPEQWYIGLLSEIGRCIGLRKEFLAYWREQSQFSFVQRLFGALQEVALEGNAAGSAENERAGAPSPLVVFIDEIDTTRSLSFSADEFFAAIRECHNRRVTYPVLARLTFCLVGSATPSDLIKDAQISPFNVGRRIEMADFSEEEALPLADGLSTSNSLALLRRVLYWTNGHPYLTQTLCAALVADASVRAPAQVDRLVSRLFFDASARGGNANLADVSNRLLNSFDDAARADDNRASVLDLYAGVLRKRGLVKDDETDARVVVLKLSGITRTGKGALSVRNRIYARVFDLRWIAENMPDAEVRRQRAAFRRGTVRTATLAGAVLIAIAGLAAFAFTERNRALTFAARAGDNARTADHNLYVAYMSLIPRYWEENNASRVLELLESTKGYADRGLEWDYWNRMCHQELLTFSGHSGDVNAVCFSPDGSKIASGSSDRTAIIWQARTGRELLTLKGHSDAVWSLAFSPDGRRLVTAGLDGAAVVWDALTGRRLHILKGHTGWVIHVAFSPDGNRIATAGLDKTAILWDAQTGRRVFTVRGLAGNGQFVAFLKNGRQLVTGSELTDAQVWDVQTTKRVRTMKARTVAAVSIDGTKLGTTSSDGVSIWDPQAGRKLSIVRGAGLPYAVAFSPASDRIVTGGWDTTARVWDARTGKELLRFRGHAGTNPTVFAVDYSPDGTRIVTGARDGKAKVWDARSDRATRIIGAHTSRISAVAIAPDVSRIAIGSEDGDVTIWDARTGVATLGIQGHKKPVRSLGFSPDVSRIAIGSEDGAASICDARTGAAIATVNGHKQPVRAVAFSPDGSRIVTADMDRTARVWDARTGHELTTLRGHRAGVISAGWSPDSARLVTGSDDGTARLWDARTGAELHTFAADTNYVMSVAFYPDGNRIVLGDWANNRAQVWDVGTGRQLLLLKGQTSSVISVAVAAGGKRIATGGGDGSVKIWDSQGQETLNLKSRLRAVWSVAFSADQRLIVAAGSGGAQIWDCGSLNRQ